MSRIAIMSAVFSIYGLAFGHESTEEYMERLRSQGYTVQNFVGRRGRVVYRPIDVTTESTCVDLPDLNSKARPAEVPLASHEASGEKPWDGVLIHRPTQYDGQLENKGCYRAIVPIDGTPEAVEEAIATQDQKMIQYVKDRAANAGAIQIAAYNELKASDAKAYADNRMIGMIRELRKPCLDRDHALIYGVEKEFGLGQQDKTCDPNGYWGPPTHQFNNEARNQIVSPTRVIYIQNNIMKHQEVKSMLDANSNMEEVCAEVRKDLTSRNPERVIGAKAQLKELGCKE